MLQMLNLNFNILKTIIFKCRYYFAHKRVCFITYKSLKTVLIQVVLSLMILLFLNALEKNNTSSASCSEWTGEALILRTTRILYISSLFQLRWFLEVASLFCLLLNLRKAKHQCILLCHSYMVCMCSCMLLCKYCDKDAGFYATKLSNASYFISLSR